MGLTRGLTPKKEPGDWKDTFIKALSEHGVVSRACKAAHISRQAAYEQRQQDQEFAARWKEALTVSVEQMEFEARRRSTKGVLKPVYQNGKLVGHVREYSDTLLIFLLKAHKPDVYRETKNVNVRVEDLDSAIEHELARLAAGGEATAFAEAEGEDTDG